MVGDLAVANLNSDSISVLITHGDGTFANNVITPLLIVQDLYLLVI
jgi:hypothetical protein